MKYIANEKYVDRNHSFQKQTNTEKLYGRNIINDVFQTLAIFVLFA